MIFFFFKDATHVGLKLLQRGPYIQEYIWIAQTVLDIFMGEGHTKLDGWEGVMDLGRVGGGSKYDKSILYEILKELIEEK